jgi:DNA-binding MarR family transcriptional regulator
MDNINQPVSVSTSLGFNLINTSWQIKETLRKAFLLNGFDISSDQFAILLRLWEEDGFSQIELCKRTCKNKSNLTRILDSMEKRNLIFREVSKQDRRSFNIFLTDGGKALRDHLIKIALQVQSNLFNDITEDECKIMANILKKINCNIESNN